MAGDAADLAHAKQQTVEIAVGADGYHALKMAALLAFVPQFAAAARPVPGVARFHRHIERLFVHIRLHKHFVGDSVHGYYGYKLVALTFQFAHIFKASLMSILFS